MECRTRVYEWFVSLEKRRFFVRTSTSFRDALQSTERITMWRKFTLTPIVEYSDNVAELTETTTGVLTDKFRPEIPKRDACVRKICALLSQQLNWKTVSGVEKRIEKFIADPYSPDLALSDSFP